MSCLTSETATFIMGLINTSVELNKERLYAALYAGMNGADQARMLGVALRAKEEFDAFAEKDAEVH